MTELDSGVRAYYETVCDEASRFERSPKGRLEQWRVRLMLEKILPDHARVADIGGGPGVHARWMCGRGHMVHLLDPLEEHVRAAEKEGIPSVVGDARALPWGDHSFDAALVFGPMYHLRSAEDRERAMREAWRVLDPGGVVAVTSLNRFVPFVGSTIANNFIQREEEVRDILETGITDRSVSPFVNCAYYHTRAGLRAEVEAAGFRDVEVRPIGGVGNWPLVVADRYFPEGDLPATLTEPSVVTTALRAAALTEDFEELHALSVQFMAVGRKAH